MKRTFAFSMMILLIGLITISCKKDSDDDANNNNSQQFDAGNGKLTCKVDGVAFSANLEYCTLADETLNLGNFLENNAQLQYTPATVGTHQLNIGGQGTQSVLFLVLEDGRSLTATSGSITIDKLDGTTEGTFTATCMDVSSGASVSVTDGTFSANLF